MSLGLFSTLLGNITVTAPVSNAMPAQLQWSDFTVPGSKNPAKFRTCFGINHDNKNLRIRVEAFEPRIKELPKGINLKRDSSAIYRNDAVELNFVFSGSGQTFYKLIIDIHGNLADYQATDNNTNTDTYIYDPAWDSHAKIRTERKNDRWIVDCVIPLGAFNIGKDPNSWRFNICRNHYGTGRSISLSSFAPLSRRVYSLPREFASLRLAGFDPSIYQWSMDNLKGEVNFAKGKIQYAVKANFRNRSGEFKLGEVNYTLKNSSGKTAARAKIPTHFIAGRLHPVSGVLSPYPGNGRYFLQTDLFGSRGELLCTRGQEVVLDYQPLRIRLTAPAYRNCVFATQKLKEICADIVVQGRSLLGKPLTVSLTGPGYDKKLTLKNTRAVNKVRFPFAEAGVGTYVLRAGKVSCTIRKLPYVKGEIWIGKDGIIHSDGKKFMPLGYFCGEFKRNKDPRYNALVTYRNGMGSAARVRKFLDQQYEMGRRVMLFPHQTFTGANQVFGNKKYQGSFTKQHRAMLKKMTDAVKGHPGFLGYYMADEPEGRDLNQDWLKEVRNTLAELDPHHPAIMLNCGTTGIKRYHESCDILMPDYYPVYFKDGSTGQHRRTTFDLVRTAAALRPAWFVPQAFDWDWKRKGKEACSPTMDDLRSQILMAICADAKGFLLYNYYSFGMLSEDLRTGNDYIADELVKLKPYILTPSRVLSQNHEPFVCAVKRLGKQFCVIAVNLENKTVKRRIRLPFSASGDLYCAGEKRSVKIQNRSFTDSFRPYEAHVYLTDRKLAASYSLTAARDAVRRAKAMRIKKGNLLATGEQTLTYIKNRKTGVYPEGAVKVKVSSSRTISFPLLDYSAFLQDGLCETTPAVQWMSWSPAVSDKAPYVEWTFPKETAATEMVIYTFLHNNKSALKAGTLLVEKNGAFVKAASFRNNSKNVIRLTFPQMRFKKLKLRIDSIDRTLPCALLSEMELYNRSNAK